MSNKCCEYCANYFYDEEYECYVCDINLDEDEMANFICGFTKDCKYYRFYDEYKSVQKQN